MIVAGQAAVFFRVPSSNPNALFLEAGAAALLKSDRFVSTTLFKPLGFRMVPPPCDPMAAARA